MTNVIIIAIIVVICALGVKSYAKKLTHGCCGGETDTEKKVRVKDKKPEHYPYSVVIGIEGMTCSHCKQHVENALNSGEGVWAEVNLKEGSAVVRMKNQLPEEELRRIITRAGYTMTGVKERLS